MLAWFWTKVTTHKLHRITSFLWPNFRQLRTFSAPEQEETTRNVRDLTDEFKSDEQLWPTAVTTPANVCEGSVGGCDQHFRRKFKVMDFSVFEDAVQGSKNQNAEIQKYIHINVGYDDLIGLLEWWKNREEGFRYLSIIATSASGEGNVSVAWLVVQKRRTSLSCESVDSILFLHNMQ
jgi:hypothetical protein